MRTPEYLDLVRRQLCLPSDYALQKPLGITKQLISNYRTGRETLSGVVAVRVAEAAGLPKEKVLLEAQIERSKTPEERAVWESILEKISGSFNGLLSDWTGVERRRAAVRPVSVH